LEIKKNKNYSNRGSGTRCPRGNFIGILKKIANSLHFRIQIPFFSAKISILLNFYFSPLFIREIIEKILHEEEYENRQKHKNPGIYDSVHLLTNRSFSDPVKLSQERVFNTLSRVQNLQNYRKPETSEPASVQE